MDTVVIGVGNWGKPELHHCRRGIPRNSPPSRRLPLSHSTLLPLAGVLAGSGSLSAALAGRRVEGLFRRPGGRDETSSLRSGATAAMITDMLTKLLTEAFLKVLAGERAFDRGEEYFAGGLVDKLREANGVVAARVQGTGDYRVKLWAEQEKLAFECTCPVGQRDEFCKHCVAVGLEWIDRRKKNGGVARPVEGKVTDGDIRSYLMGQDKTALVELVLEHGELDWEFRDRLALLTAEKKWAKTRSGRLTRGTR